MSSRSDAHANKFSSNKYMDSALSRGNINLANIRSASRWGGRGVEYSPSGNWSQPDDFAERTSALQGRLTELLVFELHKDG
jgi:hypothetical protein